MQQTSRHFAGQDVGSAIPVVNPLTDAIALLRADHRQVEEWFAEFETLRSYSKKSDQAARICNALRIHSIIEEEIFYPAVHRELELEHEHASVKQTVVQIEAARADHEYFDDKVQLLAEVVKHHVREEEKSGGLFDRAKSADLDLNALGERLLARKATLEEYSRQRLPS